ncbi:right-handed parallel beta-helix repeat-containing protein [Devosia sp. ZW T5_3]|uniref:right-handed parallel beta-helix repeat-containing protein n=1 Tax=Devosia sp. ZW T5_3 TaxID=3378085 RepID=UPI0038542851
MNLTRRHFLAAATGLVASQAAGRVLAASNVAYVTPNGQGNGTSWEDAASITNLPALIKMVGAGGLIALLADGQYKVDKPIEIFGDSGGEVTIFGSSRNLGPRTARIVGTRRGWTSGKVNASQFGGNTLFELGQNGSNLRLANLDIRNMGRVLDMSDRRARNITIENVAFTNIRDGIYTNGGSAISNVTIRNFSGRGFSKKAIRFHGRCSNWLVENCELDSGQQYGDSFAVGIECHDSANGLRVVGGFTANCMEQHNDGDKYWNGDGIASERGNSNILIQNHRSYGNSDGGYDLKSEGTKLVNCVSQDNKRNYRIWGGTGRRPVELQGCSSIAPRNRGGVGDTHHMWLRGAEGNERWAASVVWSNGVLAGGSNDIAIYAEGANVAVHLVDTDTSRLSKSTKLFSATAESSKIVVGSAADTGVDQVLTESPILAIAGAHLTIPLKADGDVTWRVAEKDGSLLPELDGQTVSLDVPDGSRGGQLILQARDSRGIAIEKELTVEAKENPVGAGAVLALAFAPGAQTDAVTDAVGLNQPVLTGAADFQDGGLRFSGKDTYLEIPSSANFALDGPFYIHLRFSLDADNGTDELNVLSKWQSSSNQRAFLFRLDQERKLSFVWSTNGRSQDENVIAGPQLAFERVYDVVVSKSADGYIELIVDGVTAGRSPSPVEALNASPAPLRVSGRAGGDAAGKGTLYALDIYRGHSYQPPA